MGSQSDGENPKEGIKKRKLKSSKAPGNSSDFDKFKVYTKPNYKRLFLENGNSEYIVYVESTEFEKLGNKNPIYLTKLFNENVKGIVAVHRINAHKIGITFGKAAEANNFLKMEQFLMKNKMKAFIPSYLTEVIGVIRYVPTEMSNEEIYKNITSDAEVVSIKRFMKKVDGKLVPLNTVAVTFASTCLPQYTYINMFRYPVHIYIPPLLQCYKCLKFNHSAKVCRGQQNCSSCAGQHSYKECDVEEIVCINCSGNHLAVSRDCPLKKKKQEEKKNQHIRRSYAAVVSKSPPITDKTFVPLRDKVSKPVTKPLETLNLKQIAENEIIINAIVKSLVQLGNKPNDCPLTSVKIKEVFLSNLI